MAGATMSAPESAAAPAAPAESLDPARERSFRLVLLGLVLLIVGFTFGAFANGLYPCVPAAGSSVAPPLSECAVALSPWAGVGLIGLVLAVVGYRRVG